MAKPIIALNAILALWAAITLEADAHRIDVSLRMTQSGCKAYFDQVNRGSGE